MRVPVPLVPNRKKGDQEKNHVRCSGSAEDMLRIESKWEKPRKSSRKSLAGCEINMLQESGPSEISSEKNIFFSSLCCVTFTPFSHSEISLSIKWEEAEAEMQWEQNRGTLGIWYNRTFKIQNKRNSYMYNIHRNWETDCNGFDFAMQMRTCEH